MAEITSALVKELRDKTQAGMMDCKKALDAVKGDFEAAIKYLREKGLSAAAKRSERAASQGLVGIKFSADRKKAAIFELNSETDFVARNEKFSQLLDQYLDQILQNNPKDMETLNGLKADGKTMTEKVTEVISVIGENIIPRRFQLIETKTGFIENYMHMNNSIGVLIEFNGQVSPETTKDIAMHIAAASPSYLDRTVVPVDVLAAEKAIYKQQALNEGKPEKILDKIAEGKLNKFYQDNCLLEQAFVKDPEKKIKDLLPAGSSITKFARFKVGA